MLDTLVVGSRHRVRTHEDDPSRQQPRQGVGQDPFDASNVGDQCVLRQVGSHLLEHTGHRPDRRSEHDEIRTGNCRAGIRDLVHDPVAQRLLERALTTSRAHDAARDTARFRGRRERTTQQAKAQHRDPLEDRRGTHEPPSLKRRRVLTSRSFSWGAPTVMRTQSAMP